MAGRTLPGLGLVGFYNLGEDGWGDDMSNGLRLLSAVVQLKAISLVASEPESPADGDIYILTGTSNANKLAVRDNGEWVYITPGQGWIAFIQDTQEHRKFVGTAWIALSTGGIADAPADGGLYARRDNAWESFVPGGGGSADFALNVINESGPSYTPVVAGGKKQFIRLSNAAPVLNIPAESSENFDVGTVIEFQQAGTGAVNINWPTAVTVSSRGGAFTTAGQYAIGAVVKVGNDEWVATGDLV